MQPWALQGRSVGRLLNLAYGAAAVGIFQVTRRETLSRRATGWNGRDCQGSGGMKGLAYCARASAVPVRAGSGGVPLGAVRPVPRGKGVMVNVQLGVWAVKEEVRGKFVGTLGALLGEEGED